MSRETPLERLVAQLGDEIANALERRGRTQRSVPNRRSLSRLLAGANVTLETVVRVAGVLGMHVEIRFVDHPTSGATNVPDPVGGTTLEEKP